MTTQTKNKSKAISSYLLSGINIKKLIQEQTNQQLQVQDLNIIKINRRPVFRIKQKQKDNCQNAIPANINNSFKIRSFTKKTKDSISYKMMDQNSQIFQKVQNIRKHRTNSNRMQMQLLINISNISRQNKDFREELELCTQKIPVKVREIGLKDKPIKCKVSNQVFIKQIIPNFNQKATVNFHKISLQKFKDIAYRINTHYNPKHFQQNLQNHGDSHTKIKTLVIISIQALILSHKKSSKHTISHNILHIDQSSQPHKNQKPILNNQQIQLLKMLSSKHHPKEPYLQSLKIAYKVNTNSELYQLKTLLLENHIDDYYCIFYPIKKYIQSIGLYCVDSLLQNVQNVVVLESKYKLHVQLPIVTSQINTIFVQTYFDSIMILQRTFNALKSIIFQKIKEQQVENYDFHINSIETQQTPLDGQEQRQNKTEKKPRGNVQSQRFYDIGQFCIKDQTIKIDMAQLNAKLDLYHHSRSMKCDKIKKMSMFNDSQKLSKRKILGQRQTNIPLISNNTSIGQQQSKILPTLKKTVNKMPTIQQIRHNLLQYFKKTDHLYITYQKTPRKQQLNDKTDQFQDITNYLKGFNNKSKTYNQIISELTKRNNAINRQINSFVSSTVKLPQIQREHHNFSLFCFDQPQKSKHLQRQKCYASAQKYEQNCCEKNDEVLQIIAYKIY